MQSAVLTGELDRTLVGLGPAVGEKDLVEPAQLGQFRRKLDGNVVVISRTRCDEFTRLPAYRVDHNRRRMAEAVDRPALHEVEISFTIVVPQPRAFALDKNRRGPGGDFHKRVRGVRVKVHGSLLFSVGSSIRDRTREWPHGRGGGSRGR